MTKYLIAVCLLLSACNTVDVATGQPKPLPQFAAEDFDRAGDLATKYDDAIAATCYYYIRDKIKSGQVTVEGEPDTRGGGAAVAFETARIGVKFLNGGPSTEFYQACGPFVLSVQNETIGGVLRIVAGGAVLGL